MIRASLVVLLAAAAAAPVYAGSRDDCRHLDKALGKLRDARRVGQKLNTELLALMADDTGLAKGRVEGHLPSIQDKEECRAVADSLSFAPKLKSLRDSIDQARRTCAGEADGACLEQAKAAIDEDFHLYSDIDRHRAVGGGGGQCGPVPLAEATRLLTRPCARGTRYCNPTYRAIAAELVKKAWNDEIKKIKNTAVKISHEAMWPLVRETEGMYRRRDLSGMEKELFANTKRIAGIRDTLLALRPAVCGN